MKAVFAREAGFLMKTVYGLVFPLVEKKIRREMNINAGDRQGGGRAHPPGARVRGEESRAKRLPGGRRIQRGRPDVCRPADAGRERLAVGRAACARACPGTRPGSRAGPAWKAPSGCARCIAGTAAPAEPYSVWQQLVIAEARIEIAAHHRLELACLVLAEVLAVAADTRASAPSTFRDPGRRAGAVTCCGSSRSPRARACSRPSRTRRPRAGWLRRSSRRESRPGASTSPPCPRGDPRSEARARSDAAAPAGTRCCGSGSHGAARCPGWRTKPMRPMASRSKGWSSSCWIISRLKALVRLRNWLYHDVATSIGCRGMNSSRFSRSLGSRTISSVSGRSQLR